MFVAFELSMPNVNSWNGRWSGESKRYVKVRSFTKKQMEDMKLEEGSYYYNFGDGWGASIEVRIVDCQEKNRLRRVSAGFYGYDWMIESIVKHGKIIA